MRISIFLTTIILVGLFMVACSSGSNPTVPSGNNGSTIPDVATSPVSKEPDQGYYHRVFGAWKVHIDLQNLVAELIPSRNAQAIGTTFDSDLLQFLSVSPCGNCLAISRLYFDHDMNICTDFRMKHPFKDLARRPDLHGFDVRLIFIAPALFNEFPDIKVMDPDGVESAALPSALTPLNADGLTSNYDDLVSDSRYFPGNPDIPGNLNSFLRFFDDYTMTEFDPHNPSGQNVMPVGSGFKTRKAVFSSFFAESGFDFYAVADVAFGQSATFSNRQNPQYYLPAFHRTEPWRVEYWIENNNLSEGDPTSTADIVVQVFDWQHAAIVDPNYPDPSNLAGIPESSRITKLELSVPYIQDAPIVVTTPESGDGSLTNPLQYRFTITNEKGASYATGLLAIRDELYGLASPHGRVPIPPSPAGFPYETKDILDYSLYEAIRVNFPHRENATVYFNDELYVDKESQFVDQNGDTVEIQAQFFMDPSSSKFQYRWDYDYDGVTFDIDGAGMPSPEIEITGTGIHHVGLRVRTNSVPPREYIYSIPVYIRGAGFDEIMDTAGDQMDTTYLSRGNAIAMSSDKTYFAFTSEAGVKRDIWLAIGDSEGNFTANAVTSSIAQSCFDPSIQVVEDGSHDGVYILFNVYNSSIDIDLNSTFGNLDGAGFDASNIKPVSTIPNKSDQACLVYREGSLYAYYRTYTPATGSDIAVASSSDTGLTWNVVGLVNDYTDDTQTNPAAVYDFYWGTKKVFVVWEDYRDMATRGIDLYMSSSSNMTTFSPSRNLSTFPGNIIEIAPSICCYYSQIGIAYTALDSIAQTQNVYLKVIDTYDMDIFDYRIKSESTNLYHTQPSVATSSYGSYLVAYGAYDYTSHDLKTVVAEMLTDDVVASWRDKVLYEVDCGNVTMLEVNVYPGIAIRDLPEKNISESTVIFTTFANGMNESIMPFSMYMGDIEVAQMFSERPSDY